MALAVPSVSTTAFTNTSALVITKPSGLAVGDLMVAQITVQGNSVNTPSGWTALRNDANGGFSSFLFWIIATSTEVSASDFTFNMSSGAVEASGGIMRITGHSSGNPIWTSAGNAQSNTATPTFTNTITPSVADSLLLMFVYGENGTGTVSGYSIVTSDPTWTEAWDMTTTDGPDYVSAAAYATRTQTTATGNSSVSFTGAAGTDWVGQMVAIAISKDSTLTDTVTMTDSVLNNATARLTDTVTSTDSITSQPKKHFNQSKSSSTWVNQDKS